MKAKISFFLVIFLISALRLLATPTTITSVADGLWNEPATWYPAHVPTATDNVVINHAVELHQLLGLIGGDAVANSITINASGTLTCFGETEPDTPDGEGGTIPGQTLTTGITISAGGSFVNDGGTFVDNSRTNTVYFLGSGSISGSFTFTDLSIKDNVVLSSEITINQTFILDGSSASISGNSPTYATGSTLHYFNTGPKTVGLEWLTGDTGPGIPYIVKLSNPTTLTLTGAAPRTIYQLDIQTGSSIVFSDTEGGDLYLTYSLNTSGTGAVNTKTRLIKFIMGSSDISAGTNELYDVEIDNVQNVYLQSDLHISHSLVFTDGYLQTGSKKVLLAAGATVSESEGKGIYGVVESPMAVGLGSVTNWAGLGVDLGSGTDDLGTVTLTRKTSTSGIQEVDGKSGIKASWTFNVTGAVTNARNLKLRWFSPFDNGKTLTKARIWGKASAASVWSDLSGSNQDASTREISGVVFANAASGNKTYTVSDEANPLFTGDGSEESPYQIFTVAQLDKVRNHLGSFFILKNDLNMLGTTENDDCEFCDGWEPIGSFGSPFTGHFNGNGHTISRLYIAKDAVDRIGLFGYTSGAVISDLGLVSADITGSGDTGGLVGENDGEITNCYVTGNISGSGNVGGLVGSHTGGTISKSYTSCYVNASGAPAGGLVGMASAAISNCYSRLDVSADMYAGGLVGAFGGEPSAVMTNCYSTGLVTVFTSDGGGLIALDLGGTVEHCYWDTETSGQGVSALAVVGMTTAEMKVKDNFVNWNFATDPIIWHLSTENDGYPHLAWQVIPVVTPTTQASAIVFSSVGKTAMTIGWTKGNGSNRVVFVREGGNDHGSPIDTYSYTASADWSSKGTMEGTDYYCVYNGNGSTVTVTNLSPGTIYDVKVFEYNDVAGAEKYKTTAATDNPKSQATLEPFEGNGTAMVPYLISTAADLAALAKQVNNGKPYTGKHFKLMNNLSLSAYPNWDAIGNYQYGTNPDFFNGIFDGNNKKITGLTIASNDAGRGLFGLIKGGCEIRNLTIENCNISGDGGEFGALVGLGILDVSSKSIIIDNCHSSGTVTGVNFVGGLLGLLEQKSTSTGGDNYSILVTNCSSSVAVTVTGGDYTGGGLIGEVAGDVAPLNPQVKGCFATGTVTNIAEYARIGGLAGYFLSTIVTDCYATGNLMTGSNTIMAGGFTGYSRYSVFTNCYSTGTIRNPGIYSGGLIGYDPEPATCTINNSFWDIATSGEASSDGGTGKSTEDMKTQSTFTGAGWDFATAPIWHITADNNGYPHLAWQVFPLNPYVVTTATETGAGSLKQMIADTPAGETIRFNTTLMGGNTITLTSPVLISKSLTILGADGGIVLNGNGVTKVLQVGAGSVDLTIDVTLKNLKVKGGNDSEDRVGGIDNYGSLRLINCVVADNSDTGISSGIGAVGGILSKGPLTLINTTVAGNAGAITNRGVGGLRCGGSGKFYNSIFYGNTGLHKSFSDSNVTEIFNCLYEESFEALSITDNSNEFLQSGDDIGATNLFTTNPKFVTTTHNTANPYLILGISPCVDAGNNSYCAETTDIRGGTFGRKLNKTDATTGTIDIGAYEWKQGTDPNNIFTWTGTAGTDWNDGGNWDVLAVPTSADIITVPKVDNKPTVPTLTVGQDGSLTIDAGSELTTSGAIENNGTIVIKSGASGTGSFIMGNLPTGTGFAMVERYMPEDEWHIISSPTGNQKINEFIADNLAIPYLTLTTPVKYGMMDYDPVANKWNDYFTDANTSELGIGKGYMVRVKNAVDNLRFQGVMNADATTSVLAGWNCIGNPFTSAIKVNTAAGADNFMTVNSGMFDLNNKA
ncbi:MAG: GLUG motif-containing protein, partial [Mariniphaga sp.]